MPAQTGYFDTLKSVAGKVFAYLASIILAGVDGKTITVTENTSLNGISIFNFTKVGNGALDTAISINQTSAGALSVLLLASNNFGAGLNTRTALYLIQFFYDGNNAPTITYLGGSSDFLTFGVSGTNTLTITCATAGNSSYTLAGSKTTIS
uniref:Uncharacterized protein n=1 Tax=viral metagenome TaxID=1070528 RepID=A0A6H1ZBZ0_9ZZZZ